MVNNKNIVEKIGQISRETGIPTKKVFDFLFELRSGESRENNKLVQKIGVSKNALNQLKELFSSFLLPSSKSTQLNIAAISEVQSIFGLAYNSEESLWSFLENEDYKQSIKLLEKLTDQRPSSEREYDQFTATVETTAKRVSLLSFLEDIQDKRLLFLKNIRNISESHSLGIKTLKYDARQKLPKELIGKFDVIFTDPPYTPKGIGLFVSRAIQLLDRDNKAARVYVCYGNSDRAKERFLAIYEVFINSGLMVRWVFDKFNRYQGAYSIGSSSSLFITEVTPKTKPIIKGNYDGSIYTNN